MSHFLAGVFAAIDELEPPAIVSGLGQIFSVTLFH